MATLTRSGEAMGTDVSVIVVCEPDARSDPSALAELAFVRIAELERRWSRFIEDSEISRLNDAAGAVVAVSRDTRRLLELGVEAWAMTGGLVDCTGLAAVLSAGYDRSFETIPAQRRSSEVSAPRRIGTAGDAHDAARTDVDGVLDPLRGWSVGPNDIVISPRSGGGADVSLPVELGFDPGGIGKGLAADIVSEEVLAAGAAGVCVDLGGDLRVRGVAPGGEGWTIAVQHPSFDEPLAMLGLTDGAVASSTTLRRRWSIDGELRHHLIDPRTETSSASGISFCTVVAGQAWQADVMAKATLLRGWSHPFDLIEGSGMEALVVGYESADGAARIAVSGGFAAFCGGSVPPEWVRGGVRRPGTGGGQAKEVEA